MSTHRLTAAQRSSIADEIRDLDERMRPMRGRLRELYRQLEADGADCAPTDDRVETASDAEPRRREPVEASGPADDYGYTTAFGVRVSVPHDMHRSEGFRRWQRRRGNPARG